MVDFLRKKFIKDYDNVKNQNVRQAHGKLASVFGICSNLFLFIIKIVSGLLSKSIAIIADSINNLSDMGSSVVTLVGFKLANMPADDEHPFGHERIEYIAGLIVSIIIMFVGGSLFISSIDKVINYVPEEMNYLFTYVTIGILVLSILIKFWQSRFNKKVAKIIDSLALEATSQDSINDCISTGTILLGTIVMLICQFNSIVIPFSLDGILGILVSLFIIYSGINLIKETTSPLIGDSVSKEYVDEIVKFIAEHNMVLGYHDLVCHMYGPTKCFMTIHIEVDSTKDIILIHDAMDEIEKAVRDKFGVELTVHMDPIVLGDEELEKIRGIIKETLNDIDPILAFHDLRIVRKLTISTVLFDIVIPYRLKDTKDNIVKAIDERINKEEKLYALLVDFDYSFVKREE